MIKLPLKVNKQHNNAAKGKEIDDMITVPFPQ
jgi:hypothetical protein